MSKPFPSIPKHPVVAAKEKFTGTGAGTWRTPKYALINRPIPPPKATTILPRGAVPVPTLSNGVGRFTCTLLRLVIVRSPKQQGLILDRWINTRLAKFSKANPHVAIYVKDDEHSTVKPRVYGRYSHGNSRQFDFDRKVLNEDHVEKILYRMLHMDGRKEERLLYKKHSVNPSIQGYWHPFENKPYRILTQTDKPNLKTEQELLQRRLIQPAVVDAKSGD